MEKLITGIALLGLLLTGCGTAHRAIKTETRDSVRIELRKEIVETIDTVFVEIPRQVEKVITQDTVSVLTNDYAVSEARIDGGLLRHSLATLPKKVPAPVKSLVERKDSIIYRDKEVVVEKPVPVERNLTPWQTVRLKSWWGLVALLLFAYRKPIFAVVRRFI